MGKLGFSALPWGFVKPIDRDRLPSFLSPVFVEEKKEEESAITFSSPYPPPPPHRGASGGAGGGRRWLWQHPEKGGGAEVLRLRPTARRGGVPLTDEPPLRPPPQREPPLTLSASCREEHYTCASEFPALSAPRRSSFILSARSHHRLPLSGVSFASLLS